MAEKFHTELDKLKQDTIELVHLARQMLSDAVDALNVQDCTKAIDCLLYTSPSPRDS